MTVAVASLTCEYDSHPIGIDTPKPRLGWVLKSGQRGQKQTAYRVMVASCDQKLAAGQGDLWDSGKVPSDQSAHVEYAGAPLSSRQQCFWKVMVWDKDGQESPWSEASKFEMGLLRPEDWKAKWVGMPGAEAPTCRPAPHFRKEFQADKPVKRATAYICGLGYYELRLNGQKVGDHVLDPNFTRYDKHSLYVTYDITSMLKAGANAMGVILGNGFYNQCVKDAWNFETAPWRDNPRMILQVQIEYQDGSSQVLASDASWKVATGPITYDETRTGEFYDARNELPGWDRPGYDDSAWQAAQEVAAPQGTLKAQMAPPVKVMGTIEPVKVKEVDPGVFVFDMGQNFSGWAQLRVSGPAGTEVRLRYSDEIDKDGRLDFRHIKDLVKEGDFQTDKYTLKGEGQEVYEPRFTYHGLQYVEVTGFPGKPTKKNLLGRVTHSSFQRSGSFECSNKLLNRIQHCTLWAYVSNFVSIPTDCPQREKNGWTGDALLAAETGLYNFHSQTAYTKWMDDLKDEQRDTGELPGIVPTAGWGYKWGNGPCWDSAYICIPWYLYLYKGDKRILEEHYDRMVRYVDYLTRRSDHHEVFIGLGDWVPPYGRAADYTAPVTLNSTGYYYYDTVIVSKAAAILGKQEDAARYAALAEEIKKAFNRRFYDPIAAMYAGGTQTALSTALYQGLCQNGDEKKVAKQLAAEVKQQKNRLNAGIHGTKFILHALSDNGYVEMAYKLATQTKFPSWGHWMKQGATTLWEAWDGNASHNHIMYGDISAWMYKALGGIAPDAQNPGFRNIIIRPNVVGDLTWVKAEHESVYGPIRSHWKKEDGKLALEISIPANATATVYVPAADAQAVSEGGCPAAEAEGVKFLRAEDGAAVYAVQSGDYRFESGL